jgi:superfamily II DNA/RNA helicase
MLEAEAARCERKREARRLREVEQAAAHETAMDEAPAAETEEERRERKRKRKEAKRRLREAGAPEQPVKKSKAGSGASAASVRAKVGDHEAAARGAPIKKSFYAECDELAALSTAVRALGCDCAAAALPPRAWGADRHLVRRAGGGKPARGAAHLRRARSRRELQARALVRGGQLPQKRARLVQVRQLHRPRSACADSAGRLRDFKQPSPIQAQCWPIIMRGASSAAPRAFRKPWRRI